tara:strand:- start:666 stop:809 length:144 start_codon:yes stop_codon:yes gene_type:complete
MIQSKRTQTISLRVTSQMRNDIEEIATKNEATMSEVLRFALAEISKE